MRSLKTPIQDEGLADAYDNPTVSALLDDLQGELPRQQQPSTANAGTYKYIAKLLIR